MERFVSHDLFHMISDLDLTLPMKIPQPFDDSALQFDLTTINVYDDHLSADMIVGIVDPKHPSRLVKKPIKTAIPAWNPDIHDASKMLSVSMAPEVLEDVAQFHQGKWEHTIQAHEMPQDSPLKLTSSALSVMTFPTLSTTFGSEKDMQLTFS